MTADRATDTLELRLGAALADLRPSGGAPEALRSNVEEIPDALGSFDPRARLRRLAATPSFVAVLATAASIAVLTFAVRPIVGPANTGGASPTPSIFDPAVEGPGVVLSVVPTLFIVPGLIAVLAGALGIRQLLRVRWLGGWLDMLRLCLFGAVVVGSIAFALHPGFEERGGVLGPILGYGVTVAPPPGSGEHVPVWYETVNPGDPLVLAVSITNPGPLPITLEGIVEDPLAATRGGPRWTAMTVAPDQAVSADELDHLAAFKPYTFAPDDQIMVYLVAKAGSCAYGPDFTLDPGSQGVGGYLSRSREIRFAYSVFGLTSTAPFVLPVTLVEPTPDHCP